MNNDTNCHSDAESSKSEYIIDDIDLLDVQENIEAQNEPIKSNPTIGISNEYDNDPKRMIKYHLNWFGLPLSVFPIYYYTRLLFIQINAQLPTTQSDFMPISIALKIRYFGYLAYFLACLLHRPFVYECRNAEGPVLISSVLEIYYALNREPEEMDQISMLSVLFPIMMTVACFMRRKPYVRLLMNPWSKDKSELIKIILDAKKRAGITDLN